MAAAPKLAKGIVAPRQCIQVSVNPDTYLMPGAEMEADPAEIARLRALGCLLPADAAPQPDASAGAVVSASDGPSVTAAAS